MKKNSSCSQSPKRGKKAHRGLSGVGILIALTFVLTVEDAKRFARSREVGGYAGLRPRRKDSASKRRPLQR